MRAPKKSTHVSDLLVAMAVTMFVYTCIAILGFTTHSMFIGPLHLMFAIPELAYALERACHHVGLGIAEHGWEIYCFGLSRSCAKDCYRYGFFMFMAVSDFSFGIAFLITSIVLGEWVKGVGRDIIGGINILPCVIGCIFKLAYLISVIRTRAQETIISGREDEIRLKSGGHTN